MVKSSNEEGKATTGGTDYSNQRPKQVTSRSPGEPNEGTCGRAGTSLLQQRELRLPSAAPCAWSRKVRERDEASAREMLKDKAGGVKGRREEKPCLQLLQPKGRDRSSEYISHPSCTLRPFTVNDTRDGTFDHSSVIYPLLSCAYHTLCSFLFLLALHLLSSYIYRSCNVF